MEKYGCGTRCSAVEVSRDIDVPGFGIARAYNMRRIFLNGSKLVGGEGHSYEIDYQCTCQPHFISLVLTPTLTNMCREVINVMHRWGKS